MDYDHFIQQAQRRLNNRTASYADEFTNVATADTDAILLAKATVASTTEYTAADDELDGVVGDAVMDPPRNITVTTAGSTASDAPATMTVTGEDVNGDALTETITVSQTAATAVGAKAFRKVTSLSFPAADGTGATLAVGFGAIIGLRRKPKERAGTIHVINEIEAGARVTTGTFVTPTTSAPNGTYSPSSAPNGTRDYCLDYELANDAANV
ncbi:MAG: hypothetical protein ACTHU0_21970 [Kofleriaceae bacterium]